MRTSRAVQCFIAERAHQVGCRVLKLAALLDNDALVSLLEKHVISVLEPTGLPRHSTEFSHSDRTFGYMVTCGRTLCSMN